MKLRNKLILSCAALAAVATTAVSTTFAWYTVNTEVTASGITAKTDTAGNDTLLISETGNAGTWGPSVTLSINESLVPLSFGKNGNGKASNENGAAADTALYALGEDGTLSTTAAASGFIKFSLYFKNQTASAATGIYAKTLTITNTTGSVKTKDILVSADANGKFDAAGLTGLTKDKAKTYSIDLLRASNVYIETKKVTGYSNTDDEGYSTAAAAASFTKVAMLSTDSYHSSTTYNDTLDAKDAQNTGKSAGQYATAADAHAYWNAVKGASILTAGSNPLAASVIKADGANKLNLGTTTAAESGATGNQDIFQVQFTIFLNGWDLQCFDACQGQTFTVAMAYSTKDTNCVKYAAEATNL